MNDPYNCFNLPYEYENGFNNGDLGESLQNYKFDDWGNFGSRDLFFDKDEVMDLVKVSPQSLLTEFNIFKNYINLKNKSRIYIKCLFCLSTPKTLQTLKEHYKMCCRKFIEIERSIKHLGILEKNILIFLVCFLSIYKGFSDFNPRLYDFCLKIWGTLFLAFKDRTVLFRDMGNANLNSPGLPRTDVYNCVKFRFKEREKEVDKLIKFD